MRTTILVLAATLVAAALVAAGPALAGTIEGSVALTPGDLSIHDNMQMSAYVGQLSASAKTMAPTVVDTTYGVAWVADLPADTAPPPAPARMDQLGQRFVPRVLTIVAGQTVEFHNSDNVFHNIFSYSAPKKFDLGRYPKGKSRSVTFVKAGAVQIYCDIHSDMRADIIVTPNRRYALIGPGGRFRIEGVPQGNHTIKVWLSASGERSATIGVPERGVASLPTIMP